MIGRIDDKGSLVAAPLANGGADAELGGLIVRAQIHKSHMGKTAVVCRAPARLLSSTYHETKLIKSLIIQQYPEVTEVKVLEEKNWRQCMSSEMGRNLTPCDAVLKRCIKKLYKSSDIEVGCDLESEFAKGVGMHMAVEMRGKVICNGSVGTKHFVGPDYLGWKY
jgi:hypothetical protein